MKVGRFGPFCFCLFAAVAAGCCETRPSVSALGPCDACGPTARLPRGRLAPVVATDPIPADPVPLVPAQPGLTAPPGTNGSPVPQQPSFRPPAGPGARLFGPETGDGTPAPPAPQPAAPPESRPTQPPTGAEPPPAPNVDVPGFTVVKNQVASGQKPFADGLTWLREKGFRTVLHLRAPGEDDTAHRRQFEARGFRFVAIEVSAQTLSRDVVDQFNHAVGDASNLPLYVYDRDGALAGGLWYLHFRIVDGLSHEQAVSKAAPLGLNSDADGGPHREIWLAIQKYLSMSKATSKI